MKRIKFYVFLTFLASIPSHGYTEVKLKDHVMTNVTKNTDVLTSKEVSLRLLKLLENIESTDDLTPDLISNITGLPPVAVQNRPKNFNFGAAINQDWAYGYSLFYSEHLKKMVLNFDFHQISNGTRQSMKDICSIDLEGYHQQLQKIGFEYIGDLRSHRPGRQYNRNHLSVYVWYAGESTENVLHDCVISVEIK